MDSFVLLLVMEALRSRFELFSFLKFTQMSYQVHHLVSQWDFRKAALPHMKKYGKIPESLNNIFVVKPSYIKSSIVQ